jgi:hypothetical protein
MCGCGQDGGLVCPVVIKMMMMGPRGVGLGEESTAISVNTAAGGRDLNEPDNWDWDATDSPDLIE